MIFQGGGGSAPSVPLWIRACTYWSMSMLFTYSNVRLYLRRGPNELSPIARWGLNLTTKFTWSSLLIRMECTNSEHKSASKHIMMSFYQRSYICTYKRLKSNTYTFTSSIFCCCSRDACIMIFNIQMKLWTLQILINRKAEFSFEWLKSSRINHNSQDGVNIIKFDACSLQFKTRKWNPIYSLVWKD